MKIPLSQPYLGEEEVAAVTEVLRSNRLALGPKTLEFEQLFAKMAGTKYAVAVNSGTSGLHMCVRAAGIGKGDEVITTPFSFVASANCMLFEGATPVFVDVEPDTFNIDPTLIEAAITPKTKAILPVHVFGQSADMDPIQAIAKKHRLKIIEDACESICSTYNGKMVGSFGESAVFAFYPNKQMTTGEGGMIVTNDEALRDQFLSLRNQGRATDMQWLTHVRLGYNYRISEVTAAIGVEQVKKMPEILQRRQALSASYTQKLKNIPGIQLPVTRPENNHTWFVYAIRVAAEMRDPMIADLGERGIQTKAYFDPSIHLQTFYQEEFGYKEGDYPVSEALSREVLILPFYTRMNEEEVEYVVKHVKELMLRSV